MNRLRRRTTTSQRVGARELRRIAGRVPDAGWRVDKKDGSVYDPAGRPRCIDLDRFFYDTCGTKKRVTEALELSLRLSAHATPKHLQATAGQLSITANRLRATRTQ